jgi:hypothetical protein
MNFNANSKASLCRWSLYFAPNKPAGVKDGNWIQTDPTDTFLVLTGGLVGARSLHGSVAGGWAATTGADSVLQRAVVGRQCHMNKLTWQRDWDQLAGQYHQALAGQTFDVEFVRTSNQPLAK